MVHTYVFKDDATGEDFNRLCRRIDRIAPGYVRAEEQRFDGGIRNIRWVQGERAILAEIEPDHRAVTVCSDEPFPKLAALAERWKKRGRIGKLFSRLTLSSRAVKFIVIPLLLAAGLGVQIVSSAGELAFFLPLILLSAALYEAVIFGWWLLLPAGAAVMKLADRGYEKAARWTEAALPVVSAVYACLFSRDILSQFFSSVSGGFSLLAPAAVYLAMLPYLIINDMAKRRLEKLGAAKGDRRSVLPRLAFAGLAVSLMVSCSGLAESYLDSCEMEREFTFSIAQRQLETAQAELTAVQYGRDMEAVARYALEKNLEDWSECPDESLEQQWERLFAGGAADTRIYVSQGEVGFELYGQVFHVTPGKSITANYRSTWINVSLEAEE